MRIRCLHIIFAIIALTGWSLNLSSQPMTHMDSLTASLRVATDNEQKLNILQDICSQHMSVDTVLLYAEQMRALAEQINNYGALARARQFMGWCHGNMGNYERALANHYRALIIYDSIADSLGMARCYNATGEDFLDLKDYYSADEYFHKALDIYISLGLESEIPSIYRNLGSMYKDYKIFETARKYFRDAIAIDSAHNSIPGLTIDYNYMAETEYDEYHETNNRSNIILAKRYSDMSYATATGLNDSTYMFYTMQNSLPICLDYVRILDSAARRRLLDHCEYIYQTTMDYVKKYGYYSNYYNLQNCKARYLLLNHKYVECLNLLDSVRQKSDIDIDEAPIIDYDCYIDCYIAMGNYQKALEYKKLKSLSEGQEYYLETTLNSSKSSTKDEFEQMLRQQVKDKQKRELLFKERRKMVRIINIAAGVLIILLIVIVFVKLREVRHKQKSNVLLLRQQEEYEYQRNILSAINVQITDGIRYAKEIQTSIMPSAKIMNSIFGDNLVIWKPLDIVSGNFYWAAKKDRYKLIALGDCLRHGVPGAFTSMLGITSLSDIATMEVADNQCPSASSMLDKLRNKIENAIPNAEGSEPANMIDIALCIIDSESKTMQFAGAHSPMFIVRNGNLSEIKSDDIHIGNSGDSLSEFTNVTMELQEGDVLYFYTDGIAQQLNSEWEFSTGILTDLLTLVYDKPFTEQIEYINYALSKSPKSQEIIDQTDDILLVGIRI